MPKIKQILDEDEEEQDEEIEEAVEEEEDEEDELEEEAEAEIIKKAIRPNKVAGRKDNPMREGMPKKQLEKVEPKRRFGIVPSQPLRYIDTESNEILAEADPNDEKSMLLAILVQNADLKEQLERIETSIGSMNP